MKKALVILSFLLLPAVSFAAPVSWDFSVSTNVLQPLQSAWGSLVKANRFQATSTTQASTFPYASTTAVSSSNLTSGNCVQASTGGLLTTSSNPCGAGSVTQISTTFPILGGPITTTGTLTFGGLGTSTAAVIGNIPYFSGVNRFANVATTTLTASLPLSLSNVISVIGSSPSVLTLGTVGIENGGTATTTFYNGGITFYNSTLGTLSQSSAVSNLFWDETNKRLGLGTSTPGTLLSLGGTGANTISLDNAATSTFGSGINLRTGCFAINGVCVGSGGGGTVTAVSVATANGFTGSSSGGATPQLTLTTNQTGLLQGNGTAITGITGTAGQFPYYNGASTLLATSTIFLATNGYIGIGTTTPQWPLQISATGVPQLTLSDGTNSHWSFRNQNGDLTLSTSSPTSLATTTPPAVTIFNKGQLTTSALQPATSTSMTIDWRNTPNQVELRIGGAAVTIYHTNATTTDMWGATKRVWVCNPLGTAGAITWVGVQWIGTAPSQTTTANKCDLYSFNVTHATSTSSFLVAGAASTGL